VRLVAANEFKRKQAAPGLKVTDRAFGVGWRMPIATVPRARRPAEQAAAALGPFSPSA
jgi:hypothetical protein